ncbi:MAG: type II toxin-antitoxin system VapC family toxin [Acidobacteria bacterium]|nr:type II toxin-antitoxin system VapC family toxin [Acidobacteriota bacterium]
MNALDTNVLARFFIDDPDDRESARQRPAAVAALSERSFVPVTVLLEFEWVMRGFYAMSRKDVSRVFRALMGIEHVVVDNRAALLQALELFDGGLDFADALHLAFSERATKLVTFDRALAKRVGRLDVAQRVVLLR